MRKYPTVRRVRVAQSALNHELGAIRYWGRIVSAGDKIGRIMESNEVGAGPAIGTPDLCVPAEWREREGSVSTHRYR